MAFGANGLVGAQVSCVRLLLRTNQTNRAHAAWDLNPPTAPHCTALHWHWHWRWQASDALLILANAGLAMAFNLFFMLALAFCK